MKNVIKKISAIAMAFTLLGAGTAITKTVAPQTDNSIVASAACNHVVGPSSYGDYGFYIINSYVRYGRPVYCTKCGKYLYFAG